MRVLIWILVVMLGAGAGARAWSFAPRALPATIEAPLTRTITPPQPPPTMRVGVLPAGRLLAPPAERPWLTRRLVDGDDAGVRDALVRLHLLQRAVPQFTVVPAYDRRVMESLPPARRDDALRRRHPAQATICRCASAPS